jgi:hypothetical protein
MLTALFVDLHCKLADLQVEPSCVALVSLCC